MDPIEELLTRGVANIIPGKSQLKKALKSKKLKVYLGIDPTATRLHLGHAVPLRKLQAIANLGHHVTFLIGDFTTRVGDTSDKESERPILTPEEIEHNWQTYKQQASKLLDFKQIEIKHNSQWLSRLNFGEVIKLCQQFSLNDFISRELIKKRLNSGKKVSLQEVLYPIMQGYDHWHMDTDLQIGATEQTFNMQAGRHLQKLYRHKETFIMTLDILEGTDGRRMSKTWGNAIWLEDPPNEIYGKVMSLKDDLITQYFTLATNVPLNQVNKLKSQLKSQPMQLKKQLAYQITLELHNQSAADAAQEEFEKTVQSSELPSDIPATQAPIKTFNSLASVSHALKESIESAGLPSLSASQIRRRIQQHAVTLIRNNQTLSLTDPLSKPQLQSGDIIKYGKRDYVKLK